MLPSDSVVMPLEMYPIIHTLGIMLMLVSLYNGEPNPSMQSLVKGPDLGSEISSHPNAGAHDKQADVKTAEVTLRIESSENQQSGTHDEGKNSHTNNPENKKLQEESSENQQSGTHDEGKNSHTNNLENKKLQEESSNKTPSVFTYDNVIPSENPAFRQYNLTDICFAAVLFIMLHYVVCYVCSGFQNKNVLQYFTCLSIILYYCTLAQKISGTINSYTVCVLITFIMCVSMGHYSWMKQAGIKASGGIQPARTSSVAI